jgi:hypothetical protein
MLTTRRRGRGALAAVLMASLLAGCNFVDPIDVDPNAIPNATLDQLLTGVEVNTFSFSEGQLARLASIWTQQMAGTDRQFTILDAWTFTEEEGDDYYNAIYTGGGLIDIRDGIARAEELATARATTIAGILKIHEAYLVGMGASIWGDLVYGQAVNPGEYPQPVLDSQAQVYADVQSLLDDAIADLGAGGTHTISADLSYGGNHTRWVAAANSLKARFYLHTGDLASAATAAGAGIATPAGNWQTVHTLSAAEDSHWWEFMVEQRSGYMSAGKYLVDLLQDNADPRLQIYYSTDPDGGYSGSPPALSGAGAWSELGTAFGEQNSTTAIISCAETQFILAEARERTGTGDAQAALDAGIGCQETRWGITVPTYDATNLLNEIMIQKYIGNFLNIETWMDYRRTCSPDVRSTETAAGGRVGELYPARLYYADNETQNNTNIPTAGTSGNTLRKADMENLSGFWATFNACLP